MVKNHAWTIPPAKLVSMKRKGIFYGAFTKKARRVMRNGDDA